jgi:mono/diheme cytochrome c family protein
MKLRAMNRSAKLVLIAASAAFSACGGGGGPAGPSGPQPSPGTELLSATGLYGDVARKQVDPRNLPWQPQYPLWSDGSSKERWIRIPSGTRIDTSNMDGWVFPVGTKIWKEFAFGGRRVETRLMEKVSAAPGPNSWSFKTYQWRADESDAQLVSAAGVPNAAPTALGTTHDIPSLDQCRNCHSRGGGDAVNGFDALQLSADRDPMAVEAARLEPGDITMEELDRQGLVTRVPAPEVRIASSSAVGRWAMGYLHGNCGNCHSAGGPAGGTGLILLHVADSRSEDEEPAYRTAVNKLNAIYAMPNTQVGVNSFRITGGSPEQSAVLFRMTNRNSFHQMPPFGSKAVDAEAVALVTDWIRRLPRP